MGSLSEEFKDQKINDLLEDYIALEKQIGVVSQRVISLLEGTEERFDKSVSDGVQRLHSEIETSLNAWNRLISDADERSLQRINEIATLISNIENEAEQYIAKLSSSITEEKRGIIEEAGRAKESFYTESKRILSEMKDELKNQTEGYRPLKKSALIGFAFAGALALSVAFSAGAYLYLSHKASAELEMVLKSSGQLIDFTQQTIKALPAKQQEAAKKELERIIN